MNRKTMLLGGVLAAAFLSPGIASATLLLDTGIPGGTGAPAVLSTASWSAAEFAVPAGTDVLSLSAYLSANETGAPGDTFTFAIYSASSFIGARSSQLPSLVLATAVATYEGGTGWTTTAVNWTAPAVAQGGSDDYWLALEVTGTDQTNGLDLPQETSLTTGTAPALGFATLSGGKFTETGALPIGLEVSTTPPVPLPPAVWLLGSGLLGLALLSRRKPSQNLAAA
jgi:hypothetical protein